jgi:hypothetical protein
VSTHIAWRFVVVVLNQHWREWAVQGSNLRPWD